MTDIAGTSATAITTSVQTLRTLTGASSGTGFSNALPSQLRATSSSTHRAVISPDQVPAALSASIYIGNTIIGMLRSLANVVSVAGSSMTKTDANIHVLEGTRISVGNISADVTRTLARIDELVDKTAIGSGNILSSSSFDLTLKTTVYGGEIHIAPQPLDLKGLNLENLDLHTRGGIDDAMARIRIAISIAEQRIDGLHVLDKALNGTGSYENALNMVGATGQTELRGVLINLFA